MRLANSEVAADVLPHVPFWEGNAATARVIWRETGVWSKTGVGYTLSRLADAGSIKRRQVPHYGGGVKWVYWREPQT